MRRRIAVVGDTLTSGGQILDYEQKTGFRFHGHKTALIGGLAYCASCKSTGAITKAGGPYRIRYHTAHEAALDRDIVLCKCPTPPAIIATLAGESWVEDRDGEVVSVYGRSREYIDTGRSASTEAMQSSTPDTTAFDEQVMPSTDRVSLRGYPYLIETADGQTLCGRVDGSGSLPRIHTDTADTYTIHWGDEALAHREWK